MKNFDSPIPTPVVPQPNSRLSDRTSLNSGIPDRLSERLAKKSWLSRALFPFCAAALVNLTGCTTQSGSMSLQGKPLSGYVKMTQVQAAYLGSGNAGTGTLRYRRHTYPFTVGGLGVGGIGISKIEAQGEVYGLERLGDFPGAYIQGRYGLAVGTSSVGDLWLKNGNGVIMRLVAKRQGLMLSLGGDAVVIQMNQ
jgi:hypothetical protein